MHAVANYITQPTHAINSHKFELISTNYPEALGDNFGRWCFWAQRMVCTLIRSQVGALRGG